MLILESAVLLAYLALFVFYFLRSFRQLSTRNFRCAVKPLVHRSSKTLASLSRSLKQTPTVALREILLNTL